MVKGKLRNFISSISVKLLDKEKGRRIIHVSTYAVLSVVALFMTVLNIFTDKGWLTVATGVFFGLCVLNFILSITSKKGLEIAAGIFSVEFVVLFTFFIISGNPAGFSIIWLALLPPIAMLFYGRKKGTVISVLMLVILIFFLWTPWGYNLMLPEAQENYTEVFKMRFPFLYIACSVIAFLLNTIETTSKKEIENLSNNYKALTIHDQLTCLYNRNGMRSVLANSTKTQNCSSLSIAILDIDNFKSINDGYGHTIGDFVLKQFAEYLSRLNVTACRWGGDEFAFFYYDNDITHDELEEFRKFISSTPFENDDGVKVDVSISVGLYETNSHDASEIDKWVTKADNALYEAKNTGRNKIVFTK